MSLQLSDASQTLRSADSLKDKLLILTPTQLVPVTTTLQANVEFMLAVLNLGDLLADAEREQDDPNNSSSPSLVSRYRSSTDASCSITTEPDALRQ
ncbi:hypothetical protein DFH07DRAFT_973127 [Mycena maculata]|uniref:Uncharacterized protein n=1 Tax=Mycena maculata TaxID=230809 RepID=A0AAD7MID8_9AGAR|nr:hypothetical protein DFH07DRAFT_973127 [Mycena maculata]